MVKIFIFIITLLKLKGRVGYVKINIHIRDRFKSYLLYGQQNVYANTVFVDLSMPDKTCCLRKRT